MERGTNRSHVYSADERTDFVFTPTHTHSIIWRMINVTKDLSINCLKCFLIYHGTSDERTIVHETQSTRERRRNGKTSQRNMKNKSSKKKIDLAEAREILTNDKLNKNQ